MLLSVVYFADCCFVLTKQNFLTLLMRHFLDMNFEPDILEVEFPDYNCTMSTTKLPID